MHAPGRLADPSAAVALLWMHRSLSFQHAMLDGLCSRRDTKLAINPDPTPIPDPNPNPSPNPTPGATPSSPLTLTLSLTLTLP